MIAQNSTLTSDDAERRVNSLEDATCGDLAGRYRASHS
jgi:hypothetical protein